MKSQVIAVLASSSLERSLILNFINNDIGTLGGGVLAIVTTSDALAHIDNQISFKYHVIFLFSIDYPYFNLNMSGSSVEKNYTASLEERCTSSPARLFVIELKFGTMWVVLFCWEHSSLT